MKAETSPSLDSFGARLALVRHYGDGVSTGWTVKRAADECGISVVQQAMRHASIATTMIYAAVDADRIVDAVAALPWAA